MNAALDKAVEAFGGINVRVNCAGVGSAMKFAGTRGPMPLDMLASPSFPSRLGNPSEFDDLACSIVASLYLNDETIRLDGAIRMPPR